jgi:hypothetical protein
LKNKNQERTLINSLAAASTNRAERRGHSQLKPVWAIILLVATTMTAGCEKDCKPSRRGGGIVQPVGPRPPVNLIPIDGPCVVQQPCRPQPNFQPVPPPYYPPYFPPGLEDPCNPWNRPPINIGPDYPPYAQIPVRPPPPFLREPGKPRVTHLPLDPRDTERRPPMLDSLTPVRPPPSTLGRGEGPVRPRPTAVPEPTRTVIRADEARGPVRPPPGTLGLIGEGSEARPL